MGFNTTVVVMNDALGDIKQDEEFGKNLARAICEVSHGKPVDVPAYRRDEDGNIRSVHCNAATVIESHHADGYAIVAVGGNTGQQLGNGPTYGKWDDHVEMLKQIADDLGYRLVRKSTK